MNASSWLPGGSYVELYDAQGNLASINPRAKAHVSLMFHEGGTIPGDFPHLEGGGKVARYMRFPDVDAVEALRAGLASIVDAWCILKGG